MSARTLLENIKLITHPSKPPILQINIMPLSEGDPLATCFYLPLEDIRQVSYNAVDNRLEFMTLHHDFSTPAPNNIAELTPEFVIREFDRLLEVYFLGNSLLLGGFFRKKD